MGNEESTLSLPRTLSHFSEVRVPGVLEDSLYAADSMGIGEWKEEDSIRDRSRVAA